MCCSLVVKTSISAFYGKVPFTQLPPLSSERIAPQGICPMARRHGLNIILILNESTSCLGDLNAPEPKTVAMTTGYRVLLDGRCHHPRHHHFRHWRSHFSGALRAFSAQKSFNQWGSVVCHCGTAVSQFFFLLRVQRCHVGFLGGHAYLPNRSMPKRKTTQWC